MVLTPQLRTLVETNLNNSMQVFEEISGSKEGMEKFVKRWGGENNFYDFAHGFLIGQLLETGIMSARMTLLRALDDEEREEIIKMVENNTGRIKDLISRLKNA